MSKPTIPQGTRDFSAAQVIKRQYIMGLLRGLFERFGFEPLETPSMEQLTTLMGKYGPEGDRLIFKILNNGLHEKKPAAKEKLSQEWARLLEGPYSSSLISERALRYDLTIPFARFVAMHHQEMVFPYRRYQMQPVWRADRPQRGRYREFWQCDVDMVGSDSLMNEAELLAVYQWAFHELGIPQIEIRINSRKILAAIAEVCGMGDRMTDMTIALDKLDKIGWEGVNEALNRAGMSPTGRELLMDLMAVQGEWVDLQPKLSTSLQETQTGIAGIEEVSQTLAAYEKLKRESDRVKVRVDLSLARGLDYYTGIIVEVNTGAVPMGSLGGGGRYDQLTGIFGGPDIPGVGISFGLERIYDIMEELNLFPPSLGFGPQALLLNFGPSTQDYAVSVLQQLRLEGISCFYFPEAIKFDRQLKYAHKKSIPFVILAGEAEMEEKMVSLKNFQTGYQEKVSLQDLAGRIREGWGGKAEDSNV